MRNVFAFICILAFGLAACAPDGGTERRISPTSPSPDSTASRAPLDSLFRAYDRPELQPPSMTDDRAQAWADSVLATLSTEEKVGQLFVVEMPDPGAPGDKAMQAVRRHHVGGFLVPRLLPPRQMAQETRRLQQAARVPLFMAADYERGVGRFANPLTELPSNMGIGATRQTRFAAAAGRLTAIESRAVGVNLLLAPVVDVNNNPANPIINIRSYGGHPKLVGRMAEAFVPAAQEAGVLTTLKHFPGHGNVTVDTHAEIGRVPGDRAELDSVELRPYRMLIDDTDPPAAVMSAHLWVPALTSDERIPATFSRVALHDVLREQIGFEGVVITDDVKMGALNNDYSLAERVVRPLQAGADVVLTPEDLSAAMEAVERARRHGDLSKESLDASVRRILTAKARAGLGRRAEASEEALRYLRRAHRGEPIARAIADEAITLLKTAPMLPLADTTDVALVQISNFSDSESIAAAMDTLAEKLQPEGYAMTARLEGEAPPGDLAEQTSGADVTVLSLYLRLQQGRGEAGLLDAQRELVQRLLARDTPVVLAAFGNPYAVSTFPEAAAHLVAYDQTIASVRAAVGVLRGTQPPRGRLPIRVEPYEYGAGRKRLSSH